MSGMTAAAAQTLAALSADNGPKFNSNDLVQWGVKNVIPVVLLIIGIGIIASARKGRISDNANTITNVVLGMCVIAGAGLLYAFAGQLTDLAFGT